MNKKGFTLVEVIAAVALIAILIGLAGTNLIKKYNESKKEAIIIQEEQLVQSGDMVVQDYCKDPLSEGYQLQCDNYYQSYEDNNNNLIIEDNTYTKYICVKDLKKLGYYSEELKYSGVDCSGVVIYKIDYDTDLQKDSYSVIKCGEDYVTEVENVNDYVTNFKECFETQNTGQPEEEKKYLLTVNFTELTPNGMKVGTSHSKEYKKGQSISVDVPEYKTFENEYTPFKHGSSQNDNNFSLNANRTKLTGTMPEGNAIINIVYSASTYVLTVNYKEFNDVQGNINFPSKQYTMYYGEEVEIPYENVANFKIISPNNFTYQMQQEDAEINVIYQQKDFNLTYNSNGGTACSSRKVTYNKAFGALCNPTRTGYTFDGWYLNGSKVTSTTVNTSYNNVTLTAKWNANKYVVTYYMGNGTTTYGSTVLGTSECTYNENCTLKSFASFGTPFPYSDYDPNNDGNLDYGWGYSGWTNFEDTLDIRYADELTFLYDKAYNIGLFAIGKRTLKIYGGVAPSEPYAKLEQYWNPIQNSTDYLTSVTFPEAKSISGWTFIGYRDGRSIITDSEGNKTYGISEKNKINSKLPTTTASSTITPSVKTNGNIRSIYQRTLTLSYNGNSGTGSVANQTGVQYYNPGIGKNSKYTVPLLTTVSFKLSSNSFAKTGYTFKGWLIGSTSGTMVSAGSTFDFNPALTETPSKTLYAQWEANSNTKYVVNHYKQNSDGTWPTSPNETQNLTGVSDSAINFNNIKKSYTGFGFKEAKNSSGSVITSSTIAADGSTVINMYYNQYYIVVIYHPNGADTIRFKGSDLSDSQFQTNTSQSFHYNQSIPSGLPDVLNPQWFYLTKTGYKSTGYWYNGSTKINQSTVFTGKELAETFGLDLSTGNLTLHLYVEWQKCAGGTYADVENNTCTSCLAGKYSAGGVNSCSTCSAGTYSTGGATSCSTCPSGYTSAAGATAQSSCYISVAAGKYLGTANGTTQSSCAAGTYKAAHTVNYGSTSSCSTCSAGTYSTGGKGGCSSCPSGYTSAAGATAQNKCYISVAAGKYLGTANGTTLSSCAAGKYKAAHTVYYGSTSSCSTCSAGTYSAAGAGSCSSCPSGYTSAAGATAQNKCYISVAAGKYLGTANGTTVSNCEAGKYKAAHTVNYGSTSSCSACAAGTYSTGGASSCSTCPAGSYCPGGSNKILCPTGYTSNAGASSCKKIDYTVTFARNNTSYGSVNLSSVSIPYGTTYSVSGNKLTFSNGISVTATPTAASGYTTTFSSWSPSSGIITGNVTITANFSRTANSLALVSGSGIRSGYFYSGARNTSITVHSTYIESVYAGGNGSTSEFGWSSIDVTGYSKMTFYVYLEGVSSRGGATFNVGGKSLDVYESGTYTISISGSGNQRIWFDTYEVDYLSLSSWKLVP